MDQRLAACLLLAKVLTADGMMRDPERHMLEATMERLGLGDAQRARVRELDGTDEAEAHAAQLDVDAKRALLDELTSAALSDGRVSPQEITMIARITALIGL